MIDKKCVKTGQTTVRLYHFMAYKTRIIFSESIIISCISFFFVFFFFFFFFFQKKNRGN